MSKIFLSRILMLTALITFIIVPAEAQRPVFTVNGQATVTFQSTVIPMENLKINAYAVDTITSIAEPLQPTFTDANGLFTFIFPRKANKSYVIFPEADDNICSAYKPSYYIIPYDTTMYDDYNFLCLDEY